MCFRYLGGRCVKGDGKCHAGKTQNGQFFLQFLPSPFGALLAHSWRLRSDTAHYHRDKPSLTICLRLKRTKTLDMLCCQLNVSPIQEVEDNMHRLSFPDQWYILKREVQLHREHVFTCRFLRLLIHNTVLLISCIFHPRLVNDKGEHIIVVVLLNKHQSCLFPRMLLLCQLRIRLRSRSLARASILHEPSTFPHQPQQEWPSIGPDLLAHFIRRAWGVGSPCPPILNPAFLTWSVFFPQCLSMQ